MYQPQLHLYSIFGKQFNEKTERKRHLPTPGCQHDVMVFLRFQQTPSVPWQVSVRLLGQNANQRCGRRADAEDASCRSPQLTVTSRCHDGLQTKLERRLGKDGQSLFPQLPTTAMKGLKETVLPNWPAYVPINKSQYYAPAFVCSVACIMEEAVIRC